MKDTAIIMYCKYHTRSWDTKFYTGRLHPKVKPVSTLLYTILTEKVSLLLIASKQTPNKSRITLTIMNVPSQPLEINFH